MQKGRKSIDGIFRVVPVKQKILKDPLRQSFSVVAGNYLKNLILSWWSRILAMLLSIFKNFQSKKINKINLNWLADIFDYLWWPIAKIWQTILCLNDWYWRSIDKYGNNFKKNISSKDWRTTWWNNSRISIYVFLVVAILTGGFLVAGKLFEIKDNVVLAAGNGIDNMKNGVDLLKLEEFDEAAKSFAKAETEFDVINNNIQGMGQTETFLKNNVLAGDYKEMVRTANGLSHLARGSKYLALSIAEISGNKEEGGFSSLFFGILKGQIQDDMFLDMDTSAGYFNMSQNELLAAVDSFEKINENLIPEEYRSMYKEVMFNAPKYLEMMRGVNALLDKSGIFLGKNVPAKYLLLFQNTNETRATGGFIGSYGILTMNGGKLESIKFDDVYNPDGQLTKKIEPPYPISLMTDQWGMRDSNWDPDFPTSADQAVRMFERAGGYSVDGVVAFTPSIIESFLQLTGPIEMADYGVVLDADNFKSEIQKEVELDANGEESPKKILADLLPVLMDKMMNLDEETQKSFWKVLLDLIEEKDVMFYAYNSDVQNLFEEVGWAGEVKQIDNSSDYLYTVHSNIGGRKSDEFINETIDHHVNIEKDGSVIVDVTIVRKNVEDWTWPNFTNFDYLRFYVPEGSELLQVDGFANPNGIIKTDNEIIYDEKSGEAGLSNTKIYNEHNKTVFANWIVTKPFDASTVRYKYRLPFKVGGWFEDNESYNLYVQKQPGRDNVVYNLTVGAVDTMMTSVEKDMNITEKGLEYTSNLPKDENFDLTLTSI